MKGPNLNRHGFTLIELIIVMAILSILTAVLLPSLTSYIESAQNATDLANLRSLNNVSQLYRLDSQPIPEELFLGLSNDSARMNALVTSGYLTSAITPKQKDKYFTWMSEIQQWTLSDVRIPSNLTGVTIDATGGQSGYLKGSYTGSETELVMPLTLNGVTITNIYQDVFSGKGLSSVYFDSNTSITKIHARAFKDNNITEISLPDSVVKLDYGAFYNNPITKITIGSDVVLETNVFRNNNSFRDVYYLEGAGTYLYVDGNWVKQ